MGKKLREGTRSPAAEYPLMRSIDLRDHQPRILYITAEVETAGATVLGRVAVQKNSLAYAITLGKTVKGRLRFTREYRVAERSNECEAVPEYCTTLEKLFIGQLVRDTRRRKKQQL